MLKSLNKGNILDYLSGLETIYKDFYSAILRNMNRGETYDWSNTIDLPERGFICGFCGSDVTSKTGFTGWFFFQGEKIRQDIYICHKCSFPNFFDFADRQHPTYKVKLNIFSEAVQSISSRFIKVYQQAHTAEEDDLDEIAGPGYGKALEILVKDYLIKILPEDEELIKSLSLYNCIEQKLENSKIKALAKKATIIRNDETHYQRKYEESDINDLKKLINATASWIDLESYTSEVIATDLK